MAIKLREARVEDAERFGTVHTRSWQAAYADILPADLLEGIDVAERIEAWRQILAGEMTLPGITRPTDVVAEVDGTVQAFANIGRFRDEPTNTEVGELWALYADPDHWGAGLGYALMDATMTEFARLECSTGYLWVLAGNVRSRAWYERQGWVCDDVLKQDEFEGFSLTEVRYSIAF